MEQGFNSVKPENPAFAAKYCEYYRITPEQFEQLKKCRNKVQFGIQLEKLGILAQWKEEATAAIAELERLTETKFLNDSKRSQYIPPTPEEIAQEDERQRNGYYTPEAEEKRAEEAKQAEFAKLQTEYLAELAKVTAEYDAKREVLAKGGKKALDNCIYYTHTKTIGFNWRGYDNLPVEFLTDLISRLELPEGVTAKITTK